MGCLFSGPHLLITDFPESDIQIGAELEVVSGVASTSCNTRVQQGRKIYYRFGLVVGGRSFAAKQEKLNTTSMDFIRNNDGYLMSTVDYNKVLMSKTNCTIRIYAVRDRDYKIVRADGNIVEMLEKNRIKV